MVSRVLMGVWATLSFLLLVAGAVSLALSIVWRRPNILMNMVLSTADLTGVFIDYTYIFKFHLRYPTAGSIMGVGFIVTFFIAIVGVMQRNHVTIGLVVTNYVLLADAIGVLVIGTFVWFFTLRERANFHTLWLAATPQDRQQLQDQVYICNLCHPEVLSFTQFHCCGYFAGNDSAEISKFCVDQNSINQLNTTVLSNFCVTPITAFADTTLNDIFT